MACVSDYNVTTSYPTTENSICLATEESWFVAPSTSDSNAGSAVDVVSSGTGWGTVDPDPSDADLYRWIAVGSPGREDDERYGSANVVWADMSTGEVDPGHAYSRILYPYPTSVMTRPPANYGWAILAADIRDCHPGSGPTLDGCGQEILIAAPDTYAHVSAGRVYWYEADGDAANGLWQYGGTVAPPASVLAGDEFGYAMAAPETPRDLDEPWEVGDTSQRWVAISAPDGDRVVVFRDTAGSGAPLAAVQELVAPIAARRFGHALATGDFNGDGLADLAVGAPQSNGADLEGRVWVYRGVSTTPPYLNATPLELDGLALSGSSTFGADEDRFGWSLAAGHFVGGHAADALVVGAPGGGADENGGICQFVLHSSSAPEGLQVFDEFCWENNFPSAATATDEELGYRVAVGNFHNMDGQYRSETPEALLDDVAASRPGYNGGAGAVEIFLTDGDGFRWDDPLPTVEEFAGSTAGARFGAAMAGGYVQESYWEDIVVGAPEHVFGSTEAGAATLTRAVASAACTEVDGYWETKDYYGNTVTIKLFNDDSTGELKFTFEDDYWFAAVEDYGLSTQRQCQQDVNEDLTVVEWVDAIYKIDTGVTLALPHLWQCGGAPDEVWVDVDAAPIALAAFGESVTAGTFFGTFEMELVSPTEVTWAFTIDPTIIDLGFVLSGMDDAWNCEPVPLSGTLDNPVLSLCE